jgi:thiol:disulfide interchange protein DsbC
MGKNVAYADSTGHYFVFGHVFDMDARQDLTQARLDEANKIEWSTLPFKSSFEVKKGDGSRQVAVFSDPDCPYCRKLEKELEKVTNVTIHYFLMPLNMHPQAKPKADATWCSKNKAESWHKITNDEKIPDAPKGCEAPINEVNAFASKVGISGTPALIRMDGKIMPGYAPAEKLNQWLDEANKK